MGGVSIRFAISNHTLTLLLLYIGPICANCKKSIKSYTIVWQYEENVVYLPQEIQITIFQLFYT